MDDGGSDLPLGHLMGREGGWDINRPFQSTSRPDAGSLGGLVSFWDIWVSLFSIFSLTQGSLHRTKGVQHDGLGALCGRGPERGQNLPGEVGRAQKTKFAVSQPSSLSLGDRDWASHSGPVC